MAWQATESTYIHSSFNCIQGWKDQADSSQGIQLLMSGKSYDKSRQCIKKQRHYFADKGPYSQSYGFSNSCVWMWAFDHKEGWALKSWCFWTVVLENILENPLDCKIKLVNPKGNQSWIFIRRTDAEAPILWATWCEELTHWKRLREWRKEGDRGWDGWMASLIQQTWVWANSGR